VVVAPVGGSAAHRHLITNQFRASLIRLPVLPCLLFVSLLPGAVTAQDRLFPDVPSFEFPLASPRLAGFAGRVIDESLGDDRFGAERKADVAIGEDFPVILLRRGPRPITFGFGVEVFGRFSLDDSKTAMISNDWLVGFNTHIDLSPWELDLRFHHESSHLGDEYAERFDADRIDWTREVLALWVGRRMGRFRAMGSVGNAVVDELDLSPWLAGAGLDYRSGSFTLLGLKTHLIAGAFTEAASATDWRLSSSAKVGLAFPGVRVGKELRLSLIGHDGLSTQRQFFRAESRYIGMEIEFQL
jgi:Protein of unknown function (DUF1207)